MGRFNLLEENWIRVMTDAKGNAEEVSMIDLFEKAHLYKGLAGDMETQNFAILRVLLAVLHTVFSRMDAEGNPYEYFEWNDRFQPISDLDEDDLDDYVESLQQTWENLWHGGEFKDIVSKYLEKWHDRFFLFDECYPFYQVTEKEIAADKISKPNASPILGKNVNRLISESANKISLFSPKYEKAGNKEHLTDSEIVRWLIMFQSYSGLSDKVIFGKEKYKASKGWIYDIGGICLQGKNLFETLMLNLILIHPEEQYRENSQKPCWESEPQQVVDRSFLSSRPDNLAQLYTNWSRTIYIDPMFQGNGPFEMSIVKLPEIDHRNQFLEPMTIWKINTTGELKDSHTPKKHTLAQSMWRNFGLIALTEIETGRRKPGIIDWLNTVERWIGHQQVCLQAVSMKDDGNATSWVPADEIIDHLNIHDIVLTDLAESGWVPRIDEVVELTKKVAGFFYKNFLTDIKEIRNIGSSDFVNNEVELLYYQIDNPFREWISSINGKEDKEEKIRDWKESLKRLTLQQAESFIQKAGPRDYTGNFIGKKNSEPQFKNIAISFNILCHHLKNI